jgi:hypothetical protein
MMGGRPAPLGARDGRGRLNGYRRAEGTAALEGWAGRGIGMEPDNLTVILNAAGDIVATAFEQELRVAAEDVQTSLLLPRPGHSVHEISMPPGSRQLAWHELHALVQQHPLISAVRALRQEDAQFQANGQAQAPELRTVEERDILEPIEIRRPLVVVPGILGSDLWTTTPAGRQRSRLWPPYTAGSGSPELTAISKLDPEVPKLATADAIFLMVYGELLAALRQMGYEDGAGRPRSLWVFPYDWTQSCDDCGRELAAFITGVVLPSRDPPWDGVDIINHSMGGLVTRSAKQLHGAPIVRSAYIASPHNGSVNAYLALHPAIGVPFFDRGLELILSKILNSPRPLSLLQQQVVKWKSAYDLLPDDNYQRNQSDPCGRFPAAMQDEIRRARSFKARLSPVPTEKHIILSCNNAPVNHSNGRLSIRRMLPALRFLDSKFELSEDRAASRRPAPAGAQQAHPEPVLVDGFHLWLPSMPVVHMHLRQFLAQS